MDTTSNFAEKLDELLAGTNKYGVETSIKLFSSELLPSRANIEVALIDAKAAVESARIQALGEALRSPAVAKDPELAKKILTALGIEV